MKKIACFVLALIICQCSLCACGIIENDISATPDEIELTRANIKEYLNFSFYYSDVVRSKILNKIATGRSYVTMNTYAIAVGGFNNVEITVCVSLPIGWMISATDEAYDGEDNRQTFEYTVKLPVSGEYNTAHEIIAMGFIPSLGSVSYSIVSVSGTFIPYK